MYIIIPSGRNCNCGASLLQDEKYNSITMASSKDFVDAIVSGDVKTVKKILKSTKNNRQCSDDLISLAIKKNQSVIAKLLIKHSANTNNNVDNSLTTSLFYAIRRKNLKIVKNLVRMGANVNWKSPSGMTPLMAAAERSNLKVLSFILEQKPNVNDVDASGNTALHYVFNYLTRKDRLRYSYSHTPEGSNDCERIILLHEAGADLNAKCSFKNYPNLTTILDLAVYMGSNASVTYLLYNTPMGLMQLDYSKIDLAAFDENAVDEDVRTNAEYVELLKEQSSNLRCLLALFIINRHEIGIYATEDTLQKVYDLLKKEEEENSTFFGYCREQKQLMMEHRQFLEEKQMGSNKISYWKFITGNREDLMKLLFNENFLSQPLLEELNEISTDRRFFYYQEPFMDKISYAIGKSNALTKVIEEVSNLFSTVLPYDCCEHIVYSMSNNEVKSFIKRLEPSDIEDYDF
ncbi:hypothetical protein KQX54_015781 [Cotesia glomerata]|uniref:Uncharacterized protein n=1 Tax=Cotesia glomerata TaxID=32391 RepID=A0AAV7HXW5_COTGL|nr:hypothetical protein KQX54_015781 [Cotesia glomerata]